MKSGRSHTAAFTLIELLTVVAIIGILAAIVGPVLQQFRKPDAIAAASRQMIDAVARGRQLAISQHTTVYMVFLPTNFWKDPNFTVAEQVESTNLLDRQATGYAYVSLRRTGDQPGAGLPHYLSSWQPLTESSFIPLWKFASNQVTRIYDPSGVYYDVRGFDFTNVAPFPSDKIGFIDQRPYINLPYIAFNYLGRLTSGRDEYIPLAQGSVLPAIQGPNRMLAFASPSVSEMPRGNSTNAYNLIHIDWLTGRARVEHREVQ